METAVKVAAELYDVDEAELFSAGVEAMIHAVNRTQNRWSARFTTEGISESIREAVVAVAEDLAMYNKRFDVTSDIDEYTVPAEVECATAEIIFPETLDRLRRALNMLPERHRLIIVEKYGLEGSKNLTTRQLARRLNRTVSRVHSMLPEALEMLQKAMEWEGIIDRNTRRNR